MVGNRIDLSPKFVFVLLASLVGGIGGVGALVWFASAHAIEGGDAYALATSYAAASADVRARVGPIVSTVLAPGESRCISESAIPLTGDATFTVLVTGSREHAKLDVRATRDAQGWHLVDAKLRGSDDAPFAVASGCGSGPAWGPAGHYGKN